MNIKAFVKELVGGYREHGCLDIDGADFQELLVKHGLCIERPATKEDAATEWAQDYDIEEGDTVVVDSPELKAFLK